MGGSDRADLHLAVHLGLLSLTGLVLYPLSLLLAPATFEVGRVLLDGPTQPLFVALINAPFFALMGFEYYVGAGGLVMGALFGGLVGAGMTRLVKSIRERVKTASSDSARYQVWSAKWYVKLSTCGLFGTNPRRRRTRRSRASPFMHLELVMLRRAMLTHE